ncbi:MAG: hypothetical protein FJ319_06335 [SAR202 cluster bacterium]|nr:hypothetical protein [SAR202 cluster bacterium]
MKRELKKAGIESTGVMTRDEAAEYWSTHEITDDTPGWEEVDPSTIVVKKPLTISLTLRLDEDYKQKLYRLSEATNVGITTLARQLLYDGLDRRLESSSEAASTERYVLTTEQIEEISEAVTMKIFESLLRTRVSQINETSETAEYGKRPRRKKTAGA